MATFNLLLDTRVQKKNDKFNLSVRVINGNTVMYLKITTMTKKQYDQVFIKKAADTDSVKFREECNKFLSRCEWVYSDMKKFDKKSYREKVYGKEEIKTYDQLLLKDLFELYLKRKDNLKLKTKNHYDTTSNSFEQYKNGISVWDITPNFLMKYEKDKREDDYSPASVSSYMRQLRSVINYFTIVDKLIPKDYIYPFGKGGFSIKRYQNCKLVMSNKEIKSVVDFKNFESKEQEYARDIWLLLYRCNGMNYADMYRMKWSNIRGVGKKKYMIFFRQKTETTRKNNIKEIVVPITPKVNDLLDKVGVKSSPYILGLYEEGFTEESVLNKSEWQRHKLNEQLKTIEEKLSLSVELRLASARDCYGTTLKRAGINNYQIGEMYGHADVLTTEHYLATMDLEKTWKINEKIL